MSDIYTSFIEPEFIRQITSGGVGVLPTDTLYGLICGIYSSEAIERVYAIKQRQPDKPCILLASSLDDLLDMDGLDRNTLLNAERYWPAALTVVVPCRAGALRQVHRGTQSIACRIPDDEPLRQLLSLTGPLIAPSANPEGKPPARNLAEAQAYFGNKVDFYVDGGELAATRPSTIITFDEDGLVTVLREGPVQV